MQAYRAFIYRFLSLAFSYPREETLTTLERSLEDLGRSLEDLRISYDVAALRSLVSGARHRLLDLQGEYNALFATSLKAPSWETAYELDKTARRASELSDIEGFYRAFGLRLSAPVEPDSLIAELEFLSLLLQKEIHALGEEKTEGVEICRDARQKFLAEHLGRWFETFARQLQDNCQDDLYHALSRLLVAFLRKETQGLEGNLQQLRRHDPDPSTECAWKCGV